MFYSVQGISAICPGSGDFFRSISVLFSGAVKMAIKELTDNMKAKFKGYRQESEDLNSLIQTKASTTTSEKQQATQPSAESVAK